jgi:hypothetical protein
MSADLIREAMPRGLPGDTKRNRDPIPAPPAGPGSRYSLSDCGFIAANLICSLGDSP